MVGIDVDGAVRLHGINLQIQFLQVPQFPDGYLLGRHRRDNRSTGSVIPQIELRPGQLGLVILE